MNQGGCCFNCCMKTNEEITHNGDLNPESVRQYLENHPAVLFEVMRSLVMKKAHVKSTESPRSKLSNNIQKKKSVRLQSEFYLHESKKSDVTHLFHKSAETIANALNIDWFSIYIPFHNDTELLEYESHGTKKHYGRIGTEMTVSAECALKRKLIHVENLSEDKRYPNGVGHPDRKVGSVLALPLCLPSGDFLAVVELCRDHDKNPFSEAEIHLCRSYIDWMLNAVHQAKITKALELQSKLNDFLLESSKKLFDDMISVDCLVENILMFTKDLVNADRCTMFLVDEEKQQLFAHYFDEGVHENGKPVFSKKHNIRFSCEKGIAGHVYQTGEIVNIANAYGDGRFNPEVDKQTGYRTANILCMPIISKSRVVGVLQMINSVSNDHFTPGDEETFKTYAVYCAMALHCSRLSNLLKKSEAWNAVAMETLRYHMACTENEVEAMKRLIPLKTVPDNFENYTFVTFTKEKILPELFVYMMHELFGRNVFDLRKLCRFILSVRKNYRPIPYHNWFHAMHVAHAIYCMLKDNQDKFTSHEKMGLIVAAVCHDLDHSGYNNVYFKEFGHPLSVLYTTSIVENHHYKHTIQVLELDGHDIFSFLSKSEYKEILLMLYDFIIATDLANYFGNERKMAQMLRNKTFDLHNEECKKLCKRLMMTGADLCSIAKPFDVQKNMVWHMYDEFYKQGDEEKEHGFQVVSMMDRVFEHEIPKQEANFIQFICQPLYTTLGAGLPSTKILLDYTLQSLALWEKYEEQSDSCSDTFSIALHSL